MNHIQSYHTRATQAEWLGGGAANHHISSCCSQTKQLRALSNRLNDIKGRTTVLRYNLG